VTDNNPRIQGGDAVRSLLALLQEPNPNLEATLDQERVLRRAGLRNRNIEEVERLDARIRSVLASRPPLATEEVRSASEALQALVADEVRLRRLPLLGGAVGGLALLGALVFVVVAASDLNAWAVSAIGLAVVILALLAFDIGWRLLGHERPPSALTVTIVASVPLSLMLSTILYSASRSWQLTAPIVLGVVLPPVLYFSLPAWLLGEPQPGEAQSVQSMR
jgi:hypothetical protein